jgi:hypothetical protein
MKPPRNDLACSSTSAMRPSHRRPTVAEYGGPLELRVEEHRRPVWDLGVDRHDHFVADVEHGKR